MILELNNPFKSDKKKQKGNRELKQIQNDSYMDYNGGGPFKSSHQKNKSRSGSKGDSSRNNIYSYNRPHPEVLSQANDTGQKSCGKNKILSSEVSDKDLINSLSLDDIIQLAIQKQSQEDHLWNPQYSSSNN